MLSDELLASLTRHIQVSVRCDAKLVVNPFTVTVVGADTALRQAYLAGQRAAFEEAVRVCKDSFTAVTGDFGRIAVRQCVDAITKRAAEVGKEVER